MNHRTRRAIRLKGYDYRANGAYFITICTVNREPVLGSVFDGEIHHSPTGEIVQDAWLWLEQQYLYVILDAFVIMPNHLHGILVLAPTGEVAPKPLGGLIGAFKTVSTKQFNQRQGLDAGKLWQPYFHDHIIRNEADLDRVRKYIADNPARWKEDEDYVE